MTEEMRFIEIVQELLMKGEVAEDRIEELAHWLLDEEMGR